MRAVTAAEFATAPDHSVAHRRAPARRIALFGLFGCGNLGNDGSLETMLDFLRRTRPEAELFCICKDPESVSRAFGIPCVPLRLTGRGRDLPRSLRLARRIPLMLWDIATAARQLRGTDVMIVPGTGILDDFGDWPGGMPFDLLKWCLAARANGTRMAMVSIGAGPIRNRLSRWMMISAARLARYRSYRDQVSVEFMARAGALAQGDALFPDLVWGMSTPPVAPRRDGPLTIGVGVMNYRGWYGYASQGEAVFSRYLSHISAFVLHLLDRGHCVRLLAGDSEDLLAIEAVTSNVASSRPEALQRLTSARTTASLHDIMEQMSTTHAVVATRFHNIVCALKLGLPTISLGYAKKNDVLMAEMGLENYCHHVEHFDCEELAAQFEEVISNVDSIRDMIRRSSARQLDRIVEQENHLLNLLT